MRSRVPILVFLLAALFSAAALLSAQDVNAREAAPEIPFDEWIADVRRVDIPWSINISPQQLSVVQRFVVDFRVRVSSKTLGRLGPSYQLFLAVRLKPAGATAWLDAREVTGTRLLERLPKGNELEISLRALILPGAYTVGFVLFDRVSGQRSVALRTLKVRPISGDPLPEISRNLPKVEFFQRGVDENLEALPELRSRLWIPLVTRRPLHVEVVVNFAAPEPVRGPPGFSDRNARNLRARHQNNVARMLGVIKVLSQMELSNGSLHITALDILRRAIIFEQDAGGDLDWPRLHTALEQINPLSIPVQAMEGRRQNAAFFRELIQSRLPQPAPAHAGNGANGKTAAEPLRVFIVVSSPAVFERGADLSPVLPPPGAEFRAYYLQYQPSPSILWDDLPRVLRELGPRRFDLQSAEEFRRALARILADLRAL